MLRGLMGGVSVQAWRPPWATESPGTTESAPSSGIPVSREEVGHTETMSSADAESVADLVVRAVECVPSGRVVSYGDVAELVGTSPRRVGTVLAQAGFEVPWWRVVNASGQLPAHLMDHARHHWRIEGTPMTERGVDMAAARTALEDLARDYALAVSPD